MLIVTLQYLPLLLTLTLHGPVSSLPLSNRGKNEYIWALCWIHCFYFSILQYVMVIFYWSNKLRFDHNSPYSQSQQPWQVVWGWKCHPKLWARNWMLFFFLKFSLNKWERQTMQVISEWRLILTIIYFQLLFQDSTLT